MEAFGYDKKDEEFEKIITLNQVTLSCHQNELDKMIEFLESIRNDIQKNGFLSGNHYHYRDYYKLWREEEADVIIYLDSSKDE